MKLFSSALWILALFPALAAASVHGIDVLARAPAAAWIESIGLEAAVGIGVALVVFGLIMFIWWRRSGRHEAASTNDTHEDSANLDRKVLDAGPEERLAGKARSAGAGRGEGTRDTAGALDRRAGESLPPIAVVQAAREQQGHSFGPTESNSPHPQPRKHDPTDDEVFGAGKTGAAPQQHKLPAPSQNQVSPNQVKRTQSAQTRPRQDAPSGAITEAPVRGQPAQPRVRQEADPTRIDGNAVTPSPTAHVRPCSDAARPEQAISAKPGNAGGEPVPQRVAVDPAARAMTEDLKSGLTQLRTCLETLNGEVAQLQGGTNDIGGCAEKLQSCLTNKDEGVPAIAQGVKALTTATNSLSQRITDLHQAQDETAKLKDSLADTGEKLKNLLEELGALPKLRQSFREMVWPDFFFTGSFVPSIEEIEQADRSGDTDARKLLANLHCTRAFLSEQDAIPLARALREISRWLLRFLFSRRRADGTARHSQEEVSGISEGWAAAFVQHLRSKGVQTCDIRTFRPGEMYRSDSMETEGQIRSDGTIDQVLTWSVRIGGTQLKAIVQ